MLTDDFSEILWWPVPWDLGEGDPLAVWPGISVEPIIYIWNSWILDETNLTKRLIRIGLIIRSESIKSRDPRKGRSEDNHKHFLSRKTILVFMVLEGGSQKKIMMKKTKIAQTGVIIVL